MLLWFLIIISVNVDGTVNASLQYPTNFAFNNEKSCDANGRKISDQFQLERGTKNSKLYWICKPVDLQSLVNALPKT